MRKTLYVTAMGIFFAILQTCYFFQLEIWLTAAYQGFITVMVAWLIGNLIGLNSNRLGEFFAKRPWLTPIFSLLACYTLFIVLRSWPYQFRLLPFYGAMIMISGIHAGVFFQTNTKLFDKSSRLFFIENNGFVIGWIIGFFGFAFYGSAFSFISPIVAGYVCLSLMKTGGMAQNRKYQD